MITEPLLSNQKGGITALLFIIANEALERLASFGLSTNMIMYLTREYGMDAASGAQILFLYSAAGNFMPIIGAFLADTYVGRYPMIGFGCITSLLNDLLKTLDYVGILTEINQTNVQGMVLLWLTTIIPEARVPSCAQFSSKCNNEATTPQLLFLYFCLGLMSIGAGGIRSCSLAFGADQLRKRDSLKYAGILESFFSWYYVISSASVFISMTCLVYIQDALGWKPKAKANWLVGFAFEVLVASFRKRRIELCSQNPDELYHHGKGSALVVPSERIRACVITESRRRLDAGWESFGSMASLHRGSSGRAKSPNKGLGIPVSAASHGRSAIIERVRRNRNRGKGFRIIPDATTHIGENQESWVSSNINKGHYDYYYWLLATLGFATFIYYLACSKAYGPCKGGQGGIAGDVREGSAGDDDGGYSSLS
ncbi:PROTEIN NRT1/ PTR FAMILY 1.3 [Salix viminalis]|uniref:PROTEIN NRT1/ PTR FAMILY 1.3 n=1 Tax=Salix viminalis TaxID=40686 RepID=A0A9Q0NQP0_SALVM|nr:PROTEIN NRT1/ PTR FAMILY 1.3 [Salix viminalis]